MDGGRWRGEWHVGMVRGGFMGCAMKDETGDMMCDDVVMVCR